MFARLHKSWFKELKQQTISKIHIKPPRFSCCESVVLSVDRQPVENSENFDVPELPVVDMVEWTCSSPRLSLQLLVEANILLAEEVILAYCQIYLRFRAIGCSQFGSKCFTIQCFVIQLLSFKAPDCEIIVLHPSCHLSQACRKTDYITIEVGRGKAKTNAPVPPIERPAMKVFSLFFETGNMYRMIAGSSLVM